ncbi:hypothetical protein BGZ65_007072 [Modicella reniformis]|uniref:carbonic anhydrase n=1 Tax=Modicella reniformis TaxID=1440133 RepID=A0A9P6MFR8_9FUNG|nr:hypothetical protein BGZ65_007072 [Modicella reniformis]
MKNLTLALGALLVSITTSVVSAAPSTPWTYGQDNAGPQHWGKLDPKYGICGTGKMQSPIDIAVGAPHVNVQAEGFSTLKYKPLYNVLCGYDGHGVKCEWPNTTTDNKNKTIKNENSLVIQGKTYTLSQFHFHTPSEHRIDGHFADGELHLVHQAADLKLAVVGLLLEVEIKNNPFFDWIVKLDKEVDQVTKGHGFLVKDKVTGAPIAGKEQVKYKVDKVDFTGLLMDTSNFTPRWEYEGSLTTPPCDENVAWNMVKQHVGLGLEQFDALVDLEAFNSRFIQDRPNKPKRK